MLFSFRSKRENPSEPYPADLNARMVAVSMDLCIILLLLWPVLKGISVYLFGAFDPKSIVPILSSSSDVSIIFSRLIESGYLNIIIFDNVFQVFVLGIIFVSCWVKYGATPGKMLFRMRVVGINDYEKLGVRRAIIRFISYLISVLSLGIGLLWALFDKRKRTWHDMLSGTRVMVFPKQKKMPEIQNTSADVNSAPRSVDP